MYAGYIVSFEACPYAFAAPDTPAVASYGSADWSPAWEVLDGFLNWDDPPAWQERARSDGSFDGGSLDFVLEDDEAPSGPAAGLPVCSRTFTRAPALIPSTRLLATADASAATLTLDSAAALGLAWPAAIWVNREVIRIQSALGNVLTVAAAGRGYLGTYAVPHVVDDAARTYPKVWAAFPTIKRRRTILWGVSEAGAVTPLWRGVSGRGPKLHKEGAPFAIRCEGIWTFRRNLPLGDEFATTRFRGINAGGVACGVRPDADATSQIGILWNPNDRPTVSTLTEACRLAQDNIRSRLAAAGITSANPVVRPENGGVVFRLDASAGVSNAEVQLRVGNESAVARTTESSGARRAEARVDSAPSVLVVTSPTHSDNVLAVTTLARMPSSWAAVAGLATHAGARTTITPVLRGALDEESVVDVLVLETHATGSHANGTAAPYLVGSARVIPRDGAPPPITNARSGRMIQYIERDVALKITARVQTDHWAAGFAAAVSDAARGTLRTIGTDRDWDFSAAVMARLIAATGGPTAARDWTLDGGLTEGELLEEELVLGGCALSLRGSRLAIVPIGPATASTEVAAVLTEDDLVEGERIAWEELDEEQITSVEADVEGTRIRVNDDTARNSFGPGQTVAVSLRGRQNAIRALSDIDAFRDAILARVIGPYSEPVGMVSIPLADLETFGSLAIGDYVDISEWLAPDGTGGRGLGNAAALAETGELSTRAQVIGRDPDLGAGTLTLHCLLFPQGWGYAPACKVASSPTTTTVTVATAYINGVGDYNDPDAGTADGGASRLPPPSAVYFREQDAASPTDYGPYIVQSVVGTTITLTTALDPALRTAIAGGAWYDVVSDDFAGADVTDDQRRYAYVGDDVTGLIDGSGVPNRPWSP